MIAPIICLVVFCVSFFVMLYVMDRPDYFEGISVSPRKASIYDLPENTSRATVDKYINDQIIPAANYFSMRYDFDAAEDSSDVFISLFMILAPAILLLRSVFRWLAEENTSTIIGACAVSIVLCVIFALIIKKIYDTYLSVPSLKDRYDDPISYVKNTEDEFDVGFTRCCENRMTLVYCAYCYKIEKTMRKRIALKSVVVSICTVIYILFFFRNPYE